MSDAELLEAMGASSKPTVETMSDEELLGSLKATGYVEDKQRDMEQSAYIENLKEHGGAVAAGRGLTQGVTLGFSDEIEGAVKAGISKMQGDEREFSQIYADKRDQARKENEMSAQLSPETYLGGEVVGGIGTAFAGGPLTAGYRGAVLLGGLSGVGLSNKTGSELAKDAALGATIGAAGEFVFKGIGNKIRNVFNRTKNPKVLQAFTELGESRHPANVEFEKATIKDIALGNYANADEWLASENAAVLATKGMDEAPEIVDKILKDEFALAGAQLKAAKNKLGEEIKLNMSSLAKQLDEELKNIVNVFGDKQAINKVKRDILNPLEEGKFGTINEPFDISNLTIDQAHKIKRNIAEFTYGRNGKDPFINSKEVSAALKRFTDGLVDGFNTIDDDIAAANARFKSLYDIEELAPRTSSDLFKLTNKLDMSIRGKELRQFVSSLNQYNPEVLKEMVTAVNPRLKMADAVLEVQQLFGRVDNSLLFQLKGAHSAAGPVGVGLSLGKGALYQSAQALRKATKLPRSTDGLMRNYESVVAKLSQVSPGLAVAFNDAVITEDRETIKQIAVQAIQAYPQEFEPGMGFEGQFTSPEELEAYANSIRTSNLSTRQKRELITQARSTNQIPQAAEPESPFFKIYKARQKVNGMKVQDY